MKHADISSSEKEAYQRNTPQAIAKIYSRPCAPMRRSLRGRDAALARSDAGIRSLDRKNGSAAVDEALSKFNAHRSRLSRVRQSLLRCLDRKNESTAAARPRKRLRLTRLSAAEHGA